MPYIRRRWGETAGANDVIAVSANIHAGQKAGAVGDLDSGMAEVDVPSLGGSHHERVWQSAPLRLGNCLVVIEIKDNQPADRARDDADVAAWRGLEPCLNVAARSLVGWFSGIRLNPISCRASQS